MWFEPTGKRSLETMGGRTLSPYGESVISNYENMEDRDFLKNKVVLDYILSQTAEGECPYVKVNVLGHDFYGLLDSGANKTFIGESGWRILKDFDLKINIDKAVSVTVANNDSCVCIGVVNVPIRLRDTVKIIEAYVVPALRHDLVLGVNFWKKMGIVPDLRRGEWYFSKEPASPPTISNIMCAEDLSNEQREELNRAIENYFSRIEPGKIGCTSLVKHKIVTSNSPIKQRYYPVSPYKQKLIDEELDKMIKAEVVEKSNSAWSSPVLLVPKKDGSQRFCVDFRKLNRVTEKDAYPLPYISSILSRLGGAKYLTSLDLKSGYWQIELEEESKQYTAFTIPGRGLYQFKRLPFGLSNAPATFQRLVDAIFGPELEPFVFTYLDDIVIVTSSFQKHIEILNEVFTRLSTAGLTLNREKCSFCRAELKYLGYVVNRHGLHVDPEKVEAMVNLPTPNNISEVRRIIGTISWYRRFVPRFSEMIAPLTHLLRKRNKFQWTLDCEEAFQKIKDALVSASILATPDFEQPFYLQTDASAYGIGAVLFQRRNEQEHVISYLSRALSKTESKYSATERELLAVVWSLDKLRCYVEGAKLTIITDHYSLLWLDNLKDPNGRLGRWALKLQQYDYRVEHRKGKENIVPDMLSRGVVTTTGNTVLNLIEFEEIKDKWYKNMAKKVENAPLRYSKWQVREGKLFKAVRVDFPELRSVKDCWKMVIPKEKRKEVLRECHDMPTAGHLGIYKTHDRVARRYYWPMMKSDISRYVNSCETCQRIKPEQKLPAGHMREQQRTAEQPWQIISMDLVGPLPRSSKGHCYVFVVTDNFSKYSLFFPLRKATASSVVKILEEQIFHVYGVPELIQSDNGTQFTSKALTRLIEQYSVKLRFNPYYHPQANPTERVNRVLKTMITAYIKQENHRTWDVHLSEIGCAVRTAKHETTGLSPYFINFGREMCLNGKEYYQNLPSEEQNKSLVTLRERASAIEKLRETVKKRLQQASEKVCRRYNLRRRNVQFEDGDLVWRRKYVLSDATKYFASKLAGRFEGPYRIRNKPGYCVYALEDLNGTPKGHWHVKDLKPYISASETPD